MITRIADREDQCAQCGHPIEPGDTVAIYGYGKNKRCYRLNGCHPVPAHIAARIQRRAGNTGHRQYNQPTTITVERIVVETSSSSAKEAFLNALNRRNK